MSTDKKQRPPQKSKPHYHGHRQRLREKFLAQGADNLADYEILELILMQSIPRRDVKPLAKDMLTKFGSIGDVCLAPAEQLRSFSGVGDTVIGHLKLLQVASRYIHQSKLSHGTIFSNWEQLLDYCFALVAGETVEQFRVLFLNSRNEFLGDKIMSRGTVNHTTAYPREILKEALNNGATAIVLLHNHPSGNPNPSREDVDTTYAIKQALEATDIKLHDHIIIAKNNYVSLKNEGLI